MNETVATPPVATPPVRQRIKEWGEVADLWTKVGVRVGGFLTLAFGGHAVVDILQKAVGG